MSDSNPNIVISKDGMRGTLIEGMPRDAGTRHVMVEFESGQRVLVPADALTLQADGRYYYLAARVADVEQEQGSAPIESTDESYVVPVVEEVLDITRRETEIGRVRVHKQVHERTERVDEPLLRDEVTVTRVPVNRVITEPAAARQEGDTLIVPVYEELLVVEKRLLLVEEVHITRHTHETHQPQDVTLRREEVVVERLAPHGEQHADQAEPQS
jgi:uncharacterized protein (TIGR02271 family)